MQSWTSPLRIEVAGLMIDDLQDKTLQLVDTPTREREFEVRISIENFATYPRRLGYCPLRNVLIRWHAINRTYVLYMSTGLGCKI